MPLAYAQKTAAENHKRKQNKTVRERATPDALTDFSVLFQLMVSYRIPMTIKESLVLSSFPDCTVCYHCPRCQSLLEREFLAYCSQCGQCLNWSNYRKAKQRYHPAIKYPHTYKRKDKL